MRILSYIVAFLLIALCITSGGWWLCCNKPCDPEIITVKGDTVFIAPEPVNVIGLQEFPDLKPKHGLFKRKERTTHTVKYGETLYGLSTRKYGIPVAAMIALNGLKSDQLTEGQTLKIGTAAERDSIRKSYHADSLYTYEKQYGDSAIKISVYTQSTGPMLSQSIRYELTATKPRNRLFIGVGYDAMTGVSALGAYELKTGWLTTAGYNPTFGSVQLGVLKRIR